MMGPMMKPDDSKDLKSLDGGVMGEGGCPSRAEVKTSTFGYRRSASLRLRNIGEALRKVKKIL